MAPNSLDATGLTIKTLDEIVTDLTASFTSIYGTDTSTEASTPDGDLINGFAQQILDALELDAQIAATMDPDQCIGTTLDMRCALNGIKRQGGTFTLQEVQIVTDRALPLPGLDAAITDVNGSGYTLADDAGNQFILANSTNIAGPGTYTLTFRAQAIGAVQTSPNTITTPVTIIPGVLSVNNPNPALSIGQDQEQDGALKIRRRKSVAISATGFADAVEAAVSNVPGVTYARCYENITSGTDGDGTPAHSIWVIVEGGDYAAIAQAIYAKRSGGSGMRGAISRVVTRANGLPLTILFDIVATTRLYASLYLNAVSGNLATTGNTTNGSNIVTNIPTTAGMAPGYPFRGAGIPAGAQILSVDSNTQVHLRTKTGAAANATATAAAVALTVVPFVASVVQATLAAGLVPGIYETMDINQISSVIKAAIPNSLVTFPTGTGFSSDNVTFAYQLTPASKNLQFTLAAGDISIL